MFAIVSPFSQSFDDIWFTYKIPDELKGILKLWHIVNIPFGKKKLYWIVIWITIDTNFDKSKIKEINNIYSEDVFSYDYQVKLLIWISKYYFSLIHSSTSLFFPKNLVWKIIKNKFSFNKTLSNSTYKFEYYKTLNQNQQKVFNDIIESEKNKFLLYWITWSWKTEIYINLIKYYLDNAKQSLLLVPEIILTNQIFERIKKVFGPDVLIINSTVAESKKTLYFDMIYQSKAKIIIWTRSALFYPYKDLWIIIIDEEHDNSYISDNTPRYNGIEIANQISNLTNCKLLLWSWTPKINHLYQRLKGEYKVLNLFNEFI